MMANEASIRSFIEELSTFAGKAEGVLNRIESEESAPDDMSREFSVFSEQMIAIRGTADQLGFPNISQIAGLGEEISVKAAGVTSRNQTRKCVSSLWDALTTIKFMLQNTETSTNEEQAILISRLENVLKFLGGARQTVNADEIAQLLAQQSRD